MNPATPFVFTRNALTLVLLALSLVFSAALLTGCGSGSQMGGTPPPAGNTQVVLLLTSTANDQLLAFSTNVTSIALADAAGTTTVFTSPQPTGQIVEWMHLNGASEPFLTATLPQGTYTSAQVTVASCYFENAVFSTTLTVSTDDEGTCSQGTGITTVNLPNPIVVTGKAMALSLNLQVPQSFSLTAATPPATYTISPVFTLTPVALSAQPTNETNGKITGLDAQVTAVNATGNSFTVQTTDGAALTVAANATTTYQGLAGLSALAPNALSNLDLAIQPDGSFLATRVEVDDATAPVAVVGAYISPGNLAGEVTTVTLQLNGCQVAGAPFCGNLFQNTDTTVFATSGQFTNVATLPFPATFNASTETPGESISNLFPGTFNAQGFQNTSTVVLVPQTLNGTVTAVTNQNGFAVYTVSLASYDLFPTLQLFNVIGPPLTAPTTLVVYVDTSAQMLNTGAIQVGSLLRFRGIVFNDNGALRMDVGQILDGVPE